MVVKPTQHTKPSTLVCTPKGQIT